MLPQVHSNLSGVSWDSAATECGQYGLENDQHILGNISDLVGKTFWIGEKVYHVTLPWMEILGRYLDTNLTMFRVVPMYLLYEGELSSRMYEGAVVVMNVCYVNLPLSVQSVSITTTLVKSNIAHGEDYSIHHYVINFVSDFLQVNGFRWRFFYPVYVLLLTSSQKVRLSKLPILSDHDAGYCRSASCALHYISTFLLVLIVKDWD
jgi:hypothetical protein